MGDHFYTVPQYDPARTARSHAHGYAMPSGHPISWGAITRGTCLEGTPYPGVRTPTVIRAECEAGVVADGLGRAA